MSKSVRTTVLLAAGYGLARAVTSNAYITAFGAEVGTSHGFVAQTSFSLITNIVGAFATLVLVAFVLAGFAHGGSRDVRRPFSFVGGYVPPASFACSTAVMLAGYAAGASGLLFSLDPGVGSLVCGLIYAVGSAVMTLAWFEPFVFEPDVRVAVRGLVCGFLVQAAGYFVLSYVDGWALFVAALVILALSGVVHWRLVREISAEVDAGREDGGAVAVAASDVSASGGRGAASGGMREVLSLLKKTLHGYFSSFLCIFVLTAVVGLLHTSVIGSTFEPVVGAVPMAEALVLAAVLLAAVVLLSRRVPETSTVYRVLFPFMLVALSTLPFIPGAFGHYAGMVMVVCYDLVGMAFVLFLVETARRVSVPSVALMGVYQVGTQLSLVVGLALGMALNGLEARAAASYATILILVCIYLLAMVPAVLLRRRDKGAAAVVSPGASGESVAADGGAQSKDAVVAVAAEQDFEQQQEVRGRVGARVEEWAIEHGLTARESQVLVQLARGWSANAIAADLGITQNTAWAHIKRIYVKLDVHSKQELIEYIEREVIDRPEA